MTPQKHSGNGSQTEEDFQLKLMESKALRKRAQEDARLLQNRVQLLMLEEKKALKKIEETQKKAKEIQDLKQRNFDNQMRKEEMARKKQEEIDRKSRQNRLLKEQIAQNVHYSRSVNSSKVRYDAEKTKEMIQESKREANSNHNRVLDKNFQLIEDVKRGKRDLEIKKKLNQDKIRDLARKGYETKINNELFVKESTESQISQLEKQEMELIERLKRTQVKQKEVFENLEKAITTFPTKNGQK